MVLARKERIWWFAGTAATVYTAVFCMARAHAHAANAGAFGLGAACDLTITVPVLYYLLLVRPGFSSWMTLVAFALGGARAAAFLLPAAEQTHLPLLRWLGVPLEIWALAAVARRLRRTPSGSAGWMAELLESEATVFYYALFAWRAKPQSLAGARAFGLAQASGYGMFCTLLMTAVIVEGVPMHLLLHRWSHVAAWISTGIGIYTFLWMVALHRSLALRPVLVSADRVVLQVGFLWRAEFRPEQIRTVRRFSAVDRECLSLVVINEPQWIVDLHAPVVVRGPLGRRKSATRIAIAVDDAEAFGAAFV